MSISDIYQEYFNDHQYFFETYIKQSSIENHDTRFSNWRLSYINYLTDYLDDFFQTFQSKEMVINTMQIGFKLWKEMLKDKTNEEQKEQFFLFFFVASCFIVLKFECPNKIKQFKNWVCKHNISLPCCFLVEKAILKYCKWNINFNSPSEFIDTVYNELFCKFKNNEQLIEKINQSKDITTTLLQYAICEYKIYSEFNQFIIALSSCFLSINQDIDQEKGKSECIENTTDIKKELKEILEKILNNLNFDKNLVESCSSLILKYLEKDDDNEKNEENEEKEKDNSLDINYQLDITRTDSNSSFIDIINNYNFDKKEDDIQEINIFLNYLGENSSILNEEIISPKEEINNDLNFLEYKKDKNKKFTGIEQDEFLLLKRKRNETNN